MFSGDHCVLNLLPRDTLKDDDYDLIVLQTKYMMVFSATLLAMQTGTDDAGSKDTLLGGIALILEFTAGPGAALPQAACDAAQKKLVDRKVRAAPRREISPPHLGITSYRHDVLTGALRTQTTYAKQQLPLTPCKQGIIAELAQSAATAAAVPRDTREWNSKAKIALLEVCCPSNAPSTRRRPLFNRSAEQ